MLLCLLAHASPRVALSGVPVCTGTHSRGGGVRVPAVFCPPAGLDLPRLGPSAPPGVGPPLVGVRSTRRLGAGVCRSAPPLAHRGPLTVCVCLGTAEQGVWEGHQHEMGRRRKRQSHTRGARGRHRRKGLQGRTDTKRVILSHRHKWRQIVRGDRACA